MTSAAHVTVISTVEGLHYLGYFKPDSITFFVIEQFTNGGLAQAAAYRMNQEREN